MFIHKKYMQWFCAILSIVLAVGMYMQIRKDEARRAQQAVYVASLRDEAAPYEEQIAKLEEELDAKEVGNFSYKFNNCKMVMAFILSSKADITFMEKMEEKYSFDAIIILDADQEDESLDEQIKELKKRNYEIALTMTPMTEKTKNRLEQINSKLQKARLTPSDTFLMRKSDKKEKNMNRLLNAEFTKVLTSSKYVDYKVNDNLQVCWNFILFDEVEDDIESQIIKFQDEKGPFMLAIDLRSETLSQKAIESHLEILQEYVDKEMMVYSSMSSISEEILSNNAYSEYNKEKYESSVEEQKERISELRQKINEIYDKRKEALQGNY